MNPFDNDDFNKSEKGFWTLAKTFAIGWVICGLLGLGLTVATIVVAIHFVAKYW